jgi:hypothetical protein
MEEKTKKIAEKVKSSRRCLFLRHNPSKLTTSTIMDNIQNTRGKGYCMMYLLMFLFFVTALVLMLYNRNGILDFPK